MKKLSIKEKLQKLATISEPDAKSAKWKQIAQWNRDHAEALEDYIIIAARILQCLIDRNMKQKELAEMLGVTPQALSRIVKGRQNLSLQTIRKIEKVLSIDLISVVTSEKPLIRTKLKIISMKYASSQQVTNHVSIVRDMPVQDTSDQKIA